MWVLDARIYIRLINKSDIENETLKNDKKLKIKYPECVEYHLGPQRHSFSLHTDFRDTGRKLGKHMRAY